MIALICLKVRRPVTTCDDLNQGGSSQLSALLGLTISRFVTTVTTYFRNIHACAHARTRTYLYLYYVVTVVTSIPKDNGAAGLSCDDLVKIGRHRSSQVVTL